MQENLAMMCVTAFSAVFVLLTLLAGVMEGIIRLSTTSNELATIKAKSPPTSVSKPLPSGTNAGVTHDPARIAAITSAYRGIFPEKTVVHIEEIG